MSCSLFVFDSQQMTMLGYYHSNTNIFQCKGSDNVDCDGGNFWDVILNSSYTPTLDTISTLMNAYAKTGRYDCVLRILHDLTSREFDAFRREEVYSLAISCFGNVGELQLVEQTLQEMVANGFKVDSLTANSLIEYCSKFGSLADMESAYRQLKKSRILIEKRGIRAVASAYIRERKYYQLGEFLRDVGLARRNTGNLLWNLLLLSYAVNFKMKSLQREFSRMVDAGFSPDLNTFNIRALAFSRMSMFWDLHLSIKHMNHVGIVPDVVTHGCVIDAYMERKLGRNLMDFGLKEFNMNRIPQIETDGLAFEAFGKGDFHLCSESLMESKWERNWTYAKLIKVYYKKMYRSNQIFWNY